MHKTGEGFFFQFGLGPDLDGVAVAKLQRFPCGDFQFDLNQIHHLHGDHGISGGHIGSCDRLHGHLPAERREQLCFPQVASGVAKFLNGLPYFCEARFQLGHEVFSSGQCRLQPRQLHLAFRFCPLLIRHGPGFSPHELLCAFELRICKFEVSAGRQLFCGICAPQVGQDRNRLPLSDGQSCFGGFDVVLVAFAVESCQHCRFNGGVD